MEKLNLIGQRFGRLIVIGEDSNKTSDKHRKLICKCDCGKIKSINIAHLRRGSVKSCGCLHDEGGYNIKHGGRGTRLYSIWKGMRTRCNNCNSPQYKFYGARGISICKEWNDFIKFKEWSMSNGYNDLLTIDRINSNGNYEPNNCRWISIHEQGKNRRSTIFITYNNETHCIREWSKITGINEATLGHRFKVCKNIENVFSKNHLDNHKQN